MFRLKMWDIQCRVLFEVGQILSNTGEVSSIEYHHADTPYLTAIYRVENPIHVTIHIHEKFFQIQLTGAVNGIKVHKHIESNPVTGIIDNLMLMISGNLTKL